MRQRFLELPPALPFPLALALALALAPASGCALLGALAPSSPPSAPPGAPAGEDASSEQTAAELTPVRTSVTDGPARLTRILYEGSGSVALYVGNDRTCGGGRLITTLSAGASGEPVDLRDGQELCADETTSGTPGKLHFVRTETD